MIRTLLFQINLGKTQNQFCFHSISTCYYCRRNIRNTAKYEFSNLYLITEINFPNGKKIVDTLQYQMTDPSGNFLGKGFSHIKENKLFYKENVLFPSTGDYTVSVAYAMRKSGEINGITNLKGITEVGFRIEKN